jgi:hypothetical protein
MRLWSLHPALLDSKGLVALWREGLLARKVLAGETRGYRHHPQLRRFSGRPGSLSSIDCYLSRVLDEARARGYRFDASKIRYRRCRRGATVSAGQLHYEWRHLRAKLEARDRKWLRALADREPSAHPCFRVRPGPPEEWEKRRADTRSRPRRRA